MITVAMVALNREWIIGHALKSLLSQTYPHDRIFFVLVDGGSVDRTVEVVREALSGSDLAGFEVVVQRSNIPEARNIAIERMRGEAIFFWDSDVLLEPDGLKMLYEAASDYGIDILSADTLSIKVSSVEEGWRVLEELCKKRGKIGVELVPAVAMGATLIRKIVLDRVRFDPELTFGEDADFCVKARSLGYRVAVHRGVVAVDVNVTGRAGSDIYVSKPLTELLKGIRKKAKVKVLGLSFDPGLKDVLVYMWRYKRYLYYLGYLPMLVALIVGLAKNLPMLTLLFPAYVLPYLLYQAKRRGILLGLKTFIASLVVGLPLSLSMLAYATARSLERFVSTPRRKKHVR